MPETTHSVVANSWATPDASWRAVQISWPIALSPFAEIVATCAIFSGVVTVLLIDFSSLTITSTALITALRISTGLAPLLMLSKPSFAIARAKIVAQVVPSPASSLVLFATS